MKQPNVVTLNIPKLGGMQDFRLGTAREIKAISTKYVGSTWPEDGLGNEGAWDIFRATDADGFPDYVAAKAD